MCLYGFLADAEDWVPVVRPSRWDFSVVGLMLSIVSNDAVVCLRFKTSVWGVMAARLTAKAARAMPRVCASRSGNGGFQPLRLIEHRQLASCAVPKARWVKKRSPDIEHIRTPPKPHTRFCVIHAIMRNAGSMPTSFLSALRRFDS